jgi:hypothetical protein
MIDFQITKYIKNQNIFNYLFLTCFLVEFTKLKTSTKLMKESFSVAIKFAAEVELKGLTHMFCLLISFYKVYKKGAFSLDFTLKIMCQIG